MMGSAILLSLFIPVSIAYTVPCSHVRSKRVVRFAKLKYRRILLFPFREKWEKNKEKKKNSTKYKIFCILIAHPLYTFATMLQNSMRSVIDFQKFHPTGRFLLRISRRPVLTFAALSAMLHFINP